MNPKCLCTACLSFFIAFSFFVSMQKTDRQYFCASAGRHLAFMLPSRCAPVIYQCSGCWQAYLLKSLSLVVYIFHLEDITRLLDLVMLLFHRLNELVVLMLFVSCVNVKGSLGGLYRNTKFCSIYIGFSLLNVLS